MKIYFRIFVVVILFIVLSACQLNQDNILDSTNKASDDIDSQDNMVVLELTNEIKNEFDYVDRDKEVTNRVFEYGCVNNASTAIKIARAIFVSVCTEDDTNYDDVLLEAYYDDVNDYWLIRSYFPDDINLDGGRMYIIIKASNAEIVKICGTL